MQEHSNKKQSFGSLIKEEFQTSFQKAFDFVLKLMILAMAAKVLFGEIRGISFLLVLMFVMIIGVFLNVLFSYLIRLRKKQDKLEKSE